MNIFTKLGTIKLTDWWRGLIIAVATVPLTIIYQSISSGVLTFDWKAIATAAMTGGLAYVLKNLSTGVNGNLLTNK